MESGMPAVWHLCNTAPRAKIEQSSSAHRDKTRRPVRRVIGCRNSSVEATTLSSRTRSHSGHALNFRGILPATLNGCSRSGPGKQCRSCGGTTAQNTLRSPHGTSNNSAHQIGKSSSLTGAPRAWNFGIQPQRETSSRLY